MSALGFTKEARRSPPPPKTISVTAPEEIVAPRRNYLGLQNFLLAFVAGASDLMTVYKYSFFASSISGNFIIVVSSIAGGVDQSRVLFLVFAFVIFSMGVVVGDTIMLRSGRACLIAATATMALTTCLRIASVDSAFVVLPVVFAMSMLNIYYENTLDEKGVVTVTTGALYSIVRGITWRKNIDDFRLSLVNFAGFTTGAFVCVACISIAKAGGSGVPDG
jgi:uncharacterized membrane protein YoaK (UPF0700 family)